MEGWREGARGSKGEADRFKSIQLTQKTDNMYFYNFLLLSCFYAAVTFFTCTHVSVCVCEREGERWGGHGSSNIAGREIYK